LAVFAATSLGLISANASTLVQSFDGPSKAITKTTPNHAVFLKCKVDGNWEYQSKGVILKLPPEFEKLETDIALVTAHGLKHDNNCYINDFQGNSRNVLGTYLAKNYHPGTDSDWPSYLSSV